MMEKKTSKKTFLCSRAPQPRSKTRFDNQTFDLHVLAMTEHFVPFNQRRVATYALSSKSNLLL